MNDMTPYEKLTYWWQLAERAYFDPGIMAHDLLAIQAGRKPMVLDENGNPRGIQYILDSWKRNKRNAGRLLNEAFIWRLLSEYEVSKKNAVKVNLGPDLTKRFAILGRELGKQVQKDLRGNE